MDAIDTAPSTKANLSRSRFTAGWGLPGAPIYLRTPDLRSALLGDDYLRLAIAARVPIIDDEGARFQ